VYVNLFIGSRGQIDVGGKRIELTQTNHYPWDGGVRLAVAASQPATFDLNIRVPAWCRGGVMNDGLYRTAPGGDDAFEISVNGQRVETPTFSGGYAKLRREWRDGDAVEVRMAMPVQRVTADQRVEANRGRVALMRGPVVYCLESPDNGGRVRDLFLTDDARVTAEPHAELLGGVTVLRATGRRLPLGDGEPVAADITAVPYYANANRGAAEMLVWMPTSAAGATAPTLAGLATPSASHCFANDTVTAMNDGGTPNSSSDDTRKRFTWWDRKGTTEWAQYEFDQPQRVGGVEVYWWDDSRQGRGCGAPERWQLLYRKADGSWVPVTPRGGEFGTKLDAFNVVAFEPVETTALRIEAKLQPELSAGILQWRVTPAAR
jgi:hypothetical protein